MELNRKKYDFIDSFRGLAILLVLLTHFLYIYPPETIGAAPNIVRLLDFGARGVQLFYMVSAFTLFNSFYIRINEGGNSAARFYIRRFFRIAPLFYICLIAMMFNVKYHFFENFQFFTVRFFTDIKTLGISDTFLWYFSTFTFTNGLFPKYLQSPYPGGWSIAVEFTFYMLIPLLVKYVRSFSDSIKLTLIALAVSFILEVFTAFRPQSLVINTFLFFSLFRQFYFFALGITAFYYLKEKPFTLKSNNQLYFNLILAIVAARLLISNSSMLLTGILFFFLLLINSDNKVTLFNNRVMQHIGKVSFSIYLTQWWIIVLLSKIEAIRSINIVLVFILFVVLNVLFSTATYYLIEKRFVRIGEKIAKKYF